MSQPAQQLPLPPVTLSVPVPASTATTISATAAQEATLPLYRTVESESSDAYKTVDTTTIGGHPQSTVGKASTNPLSAFLCPLQRPGEVGHLKVSRSECPFGHPFSFASAPAFTLRTLPTYVCIDHLLKRCIRRLVKVPGEGEYKLVRCFAGYHPSDDDLADQLIEYHLRIPGSPFMDRPTLKSTSQLFPSEESTTDSGSISGIKLPGCRSHQCRHPNLHATKESDAFIQGCVCGVVSILATLCVAMFTGAGIYYFTIIQG